MLIKILLALALILTVFAIIAAMQPAEFRVVRSSSIKAPRSIIFAQVNDLHRFQLWSPWAKLDPAMNSTFAGPTDGVGASYSWTGNSKVGEGRMTITESRSDELVGMKLEFLKPFKATNTVVFEFKTEGNQTVVSWSMSGVNGFFFKALGLFMNMDKMVGADFERGLAALKELAEKEAGK